MLGREKMIKKIYIFAIIILIITAMAAAAQETLTQSIVRYRDFFVQLNGYTDYFLADVEALNRGEAIGAILVSPEGFEQHLVYSVKTMTPIYSNARVLNKQDREFLLNTSIKMTEVKNLATAAINRAMTISRGWAIQEGKSGNIVPINTNSPALHIPIQKGKTGDELTLAKYQDNEVKISELVNTVKKEMNPLFGEKTDESSTSKDYLAKIRQEIERQPDIAAMKTEDILNQFRSDIENTMKKQLAKTIDPSKV